MISLITKSGCWLITDILFIVICMVHWKLSIDIYKCKRCLNLVYICYRCVKHSINKTTVTPMDIKSVAAAHTTFEDWRATSYRYPLIRMIAKIQSIHCHCTFLHDLNPCVAELSWAPSLPQMLSRSSEWTTHDTVQGDKPKQISDNQSIFTVILMTINYWNQR